MPMGILSDKEFEEELSSIQVPSESKLKGRGEVKEVPESLRKVIAEDAINGDSPKELSRAYGVSESSISAYKVGATSTSSYNRPDEKLLQAGISARSRLSSKSRRILIKALNQITDDKLKFTKAIELSSIAKNMSGIMNDMEERNKELINNGTINQQVIIYKPRMQSEEEFDVIDVGN